MRRILVVFILVGATSDLAADTPWHAGFARVDATPRGPVRMAGYGGRDHPSEGVDTPLYVRAAALQHGEGPRHVLISVDTIGLPGSLVAELMQQIEQRHNLSRQRIVVTCTHTHCAPDLVSELSNIFAVDLTESEISAGKRYRLQLTQAILTAVDQALSSLAPAQLAVSVGKTDFAANRRVVKEGRWTGFGIEPDGPVDHSVPVLKICDANGQVRGVIFNYACHCTTLDGDYYRINADWAGYAAADLEAEYPQSVALCTIGCGADANPNPRGSRQLAELHGRALAKEVKRLVDGEMTSIDKPIVASFAHAGLSFDLPTIDELNRRAKSPTPQIRRHAEHFQKVFKRDGRLPATYPVPIQTWKLGDQLTMIFLGGEVVADYALRLKRELPSQRLWVTAYANDVLGYIASDRIRGEGGYEYDQSGIFYNLPGPWAAGTEDLLIRRVHEQLKNNAPQPPLAPDEGLQSISVPSGFTVQLVASEPLIADPINLAFGHDGALWVVEMGDYPLGSERASEGGRIKRLTDTDGDGVFDQATVFLEGLNFPTGAHPWRDGVIVSAAPEIFFARDRDGDGRADEREVLYSGFTPANPQHRTNGFAYGLDHSLHCASGDNLGDLTLVRTGETVNASGQDVQIWPDSGRLAAISGRTQYIRSRNDWGDWFGNDNSRPMYHYPIENRYLRRNKAVSFSENKQQLFHPPVAPPVYPLGETPDRFNDLFAANRFTSACSTIVVRSKSLGDEFEGNALICEPVHNLVHRAVLRERGSTYRADRVATEQESEFLRSSDPWFRPVRVAIGPDGMIWIVDMYRAVIEHPEWIPQAWQQQIDLRAGSDQGRIYRIVPTNAAGPMRLPNPSNRSADELIALLESGSGTLRDMVQQELLQRGDISIAVQLRKVAASGSSPQARMHALWILDGLGQLQDAQLIEALGDEHPGVVRNAILLAEPRIAVSDALLQALAALADHPDLKVKLQLALTLGESKAPVAGEALGRMVAGVGNDSWLAQAIISSSKHHSLEVLKQLLVHLQNQGGEAERQNREVTTIADLMATARAAGMNPSTIVASAIADADEHASWVFPLAAACAEAIAEKSELDQGPLESIRDVYQRAKGLAVDADASSTLRCQVIQLLGRSLGPAEQEQSLLEELLSATTPLEVQLAAVERLAAFRDRESAKRMLAHWPEMSYSVREAAAMQLITTAASTDALVAGLESGTILPSDFSPAVRQIIRQSTSQSLQARINRVLGNTTAANQDLIRQYLEFQEANVRTADLSRGRELFQKHCAACHVSDASGRAAGPDLSNLTDRSRIALTESILVPNRAVEPQYRGYIVIKEDGRALSGTIAEEAGDTVTLALADGRRETIKRSEIEEFRNTGVSLMPEGFQQELDHSMLRDLIEFLRSNSFLQSVGRRRTQETSG
ncbi:MAG TPA: neutral/alkaline non-lysosomal ceramidase N-terminal domain-containing protein [Lacipirellulaceae bacterium]|jgi:putative membrane-bound dehydrogenase-like protein|nr:neutral/alkaline non-lysosomal ceramidase N-terminal domain-containing protein [Lacipirellulaceae bacterium]